VNQNYFSLRFDGEEAQVESVKKKYEIRHLPTLLLLGSDGIEIDRIIDLAGYRKQYLQILQDAREGINTYPTIFAQYEKNPDDILSAYKLFKKQIQRGDLNGIISIGRVILNRPDIAQKLSSVEPTRKRHKTIYEDVIYNIRTTLHRSRREDILRYINNFAEIKFSERAYRFVARSYLTGDTPGEARRFFLNALNHYPNSDVLKKYFEEYKNRTLSRLEAQQERIKEERKIEDVPGESG